jgi:DNA-binding Lrp family transcriptional regulator
MIRYSPEDIAILKALDKPLPLVESPFAEVAARAGVTEDQVIERVRQWQEDKTIRRFGARINHRSIGFASNGMSVWNVPADRIEDAAKVMVSRDAVSHCYVRPTYPGWPYNLFAMIHGATDDEVWAVARGIAAEGGLTDFDVLFSTREFKKSAPEFFVEDNS